MRYLMGQPHKKGFRVIKVKKIDLNENEKFKSLKVF